MARPKYDNPTPGELEILKILWDRGPCTGREVMGLLEEGRPRAYTSVMSLLNVMTEKLLVSRRPHGRSFLYRAKVQRDKTLGRLIHDMLGRAFEGSASTLVANLLDNCNPTPEELDEIRRVIENHQQTQGDE